MFNVRVYGLLVNDRNEILLSDECLHGKYFTKFPGGGLEQGEGTKDCLIREFMEEVNLKIEIENHFYTTDFYQQSAFNPNDQIISIYYTVKNIEEIHFPLTKSPFAFTEIQLEKYKSDDRMETFRFQKIDSNLVSSLNFPIDKMVGEMLVEKYR